MRSRTGCLTCRQRKLKCDERAPVCGNCTRSSRNCIPSEGIVFRHNHNASMNGDDSGDENSMKSFYSYKNTFETDAVWLDIPGQVTFIHTTNPYLDPPEFDTMSITSSESPVPTDSYTPTSWPKHNYFPSVTSRPSSVETETAPASAPQCPTPEIQAVSGQMQSSLLATVITPSPPFTSYCNHNAPRGTDYCAASTPPRNDRRLKLPLNCSGKTISRSGSPSSSRQSPPRPSVQSMTGKDHELAFLLRYFSEGPACWMDLFDLGTYFACYIPVKARENPLLKYAAIACAAKVLASVQGRQPDMGGGIAKQPWMEMYPAALSIDWKHKAAVYYDKAVSLLLHALKTDVTITVDESSREFRDHNWDPAHGYDTRPPNRCRAPGSPPIVSNNDDILAASAILCFYEFLDNSVSEWAKHLNGAKSLLLLTQVRTQPFHSPSSASPINSANTAVISKARKATFWNIARQDMLAAFINKTRTRLDTEDLSLWKEAGLLIDDQSSIILSSTDGNGYLEEYEAMIREDSMCNALVWLMAKLVNFVAACDQISNDTGLVWVGTTQQTLADCWCNLRKQFQVWHDSLPTTFQPAVRIDPRDVSGHTTSRDYDRQFAKVWHSSPMRASTMQTYHMGQVLLSMNKPQESALGRSMVCSRMKSYQSVLDTCQKHSREIVSISLAEADKAVRIHSVQPLFVAGQCLSESMGRDVVLKLLHDIESDIGWATDYRVQQLVQQWQWEQEKAQIT